MLTAPMTPHQWTMKQAPENTVLMGQSNDLKRQQRSSCSPAIILSNISSAIATSPCLPSFGNISPANTTTTARFPVMRTNNLMNPLKLEYCSFQGCANFSKMQGYCHDHIHGQPAPHSNQTPFVPTGTSPPLPGLGLPSSVTPLPYLPALQTVIPTQTQATGVRPSLCLSGYSSYNNPMYTTTPALHINKRSPIFSDHTTFLSAPLTKRPRVVAASPTLSIGSIDSYRSITRCRRDGCAKDARRKGLCMEHGGRHFCKMTGCQKCAHRGGFCISHGGGRRCAVASCSKSAQSGGICYSHGGGKRCGTGGCTHAARSGGFCIKHGKQQQQLKRRW